MVVAHDLHPDYRSSRWARALGARTAARASGPAPSRARRLLPGRQRPHGRGPGRGLRRHRARRRRNAVGRRDPGGRPRALAPRGPPASVAAAGRRGRDPLTLAAGGGGAARGRRRRPTAGAMAAIPRGQLEAARAARARPRLHARASGAGRWFDAVAALCGAARRDQLRRAGGDRARGDRRRGRPRPLSVAFEEPTKRRSARPASPAVRDRSAPDGPRDRARARGADAPGTPAFFARASTTRWPTRSSPAAGARATQGRRRPWR